MLITGSLLHSQDTLCVQLIVECLKHLFRAMADIQLSMIRRQLATCVSSSRYECNVH